MTAAKKKCVLRDSSALSEKFDDRPPVPILGYTAVHNHGLEAKSEEQLNRRVCECIKELDFKALFEQGWLEKKTRLTKAAVKSNLNVFKTSL